MSNNTVINQPTPLYGVNQVVYIRESALLGFLEAVKVATIRFDTNTKLNMYGIAFRKSSPATQIAGDAIDLKRSIAIEIAETDLILYEEALAIKARFLEAELEKSEVQLAAQGVAAVIEVMEEASSTPLDFGNISVGSGDQREYTVTNTGELNLVLTGTPVVRIIGDEDFSIPTQPQTVLVTEQETTFTIIFSPITTGRRVATVEILSNDPTTPLTSFQIEGTGV